MEAAAAQHLDGRARTVDVWSGNADAELGHLRRLIRDFPLVAGFSVDLHRAASRLTPAPPATPDAWYAAFRADLDATRVVQLKLALGARDGAIGRSWRFHLCDLAAEDLCILARVSVDADDRGVDPRRLGAALVASGAVLNPAVVWITGGPEVAAYVVRCVTGGAQLPPTSDAFRRLRDAYFPVLYDLERLTRLRAAITTPANGAANTTPVNGAASTTQANGAANST